MRLRSFIVAAVVALSSFAAAAPSATVSAATPTNPYCDATSIRKLIAAEYSEVGWFVKWSNTHLRVATSVTNQAYADGSTIYVSSNCATRSKISGARTALHEAAHLLDFWALTQRLPAPPAGLTLDPARPQAGTMLLSTWKWGGAPVTYIEYGRTLTNPRAEWFADCVMASLTGGRITGGYTDCRNQTDRNTAFALAAGSYKTNITWHTGTGAAFAYDAVTRQYIGQWNT